MLSVRTLVEDTSRVSEARRAAVDVAAGCGFPESDAGRVALIATEAATNVLRHAGGGEMVVSAIRCQGRTGVQLVVMDRGPGMADVQRCLQDGYSTSGSSGTRDGGNWPAVLGIVILLVAGEGHGGLIPSLGGRNSGVGSTGVG